jgi:hypothetical protein
MQIYQEVVAVYEEHVVSRKYVSVWCTAIQSGHAPNDEP